MSSEVTTPEPDYKNAQAEAKAAAARAKALRPWYRKKRFIIGGPVIALIIIGAIGSNGSNEGSATATNTTTNTTGSAKTPVPAPEPMQVTARQIADAFDANQVAAAKEWGGQYVQFTATISNITQSGLAFHDVSAKQFSLTQIACRVADKNQLLPLANGQSVTVRGKVSGQTLGVIGLDDCRVVK